MPSNQWDLNREDIVDVTGEQDRAVAEEGVLAASIASKTAGVPVVRKFPFAYNTPGLLTGHTVYTPAVGDVVLDAWFEIDTAWDGTTPTGDVGNSIDQNYGWFGGSNAGAGVDMTDVDQDGGQASSGLLTQGGGTVPNALSFAQLTRTPPWRRNVPGKLLTANPIKIIVSQDGTNTGADPGSTQGAAILYLITATPV
jgi:hypothetical protein